MRPFLVVAGAWLATMAASNLGTPLYAVYEQRFGFANIVLTLVFATYMLVLAPSLLAFGHLSDRFGRRPLITAGLGAATVGVALFAMASSVVWLFAARAVQGLAVGLLSGAAAAALVDLDPAPEEHRAALFAALAQAGGSSAGPLIAGLLAEWAPAPRRLCFVVLGAITAALAVAVLGLEESAPGVRRRREAAAGGDALEGAGRDAAGPGGEAPRDAASPPHAPRFQRPGVPREIRWTFVRASVTGAIVWPAAALFLSVVPS
jgi:MFS family permease